MTRHTDRELNSSLLDKLLSDEPSSKTAPHYLGQETFKLSIKRDLEALLNTRLCTDSLPTHFTQLDNTLLNYGIPDLASFNFLNTDNLNTFCRIIEDKIRLHDPRVRKIKVIPNKNDSTLNSTIKFRIIVDLLIENDTQQVVFDSNLEPIPQKINITEMDHHV